MIKATFGTSIEPFSRHAPELLPQQKNIRDIIKIHACHGGFSVIVGLPGVGKSVLKEHLESLAEEKNIVVASFSRTLHTYHQIVAQLADALKIEASRRQIENEIIKITFRHVRERKTLYIIIDEAHLLDMMVLRKLRLLFERFPKNHNLVLFGQTELLYQLSLTANEDIKSRITFSQTLLPLNNEDLAQYIYDECDIARLGRNAFDEAAIELILRQAQGNLRLCRNLCYGSLIEACREGKRIATIAHVNAVLIQPHWRSHEELIKQNVK